MGVGIWEMGIWSLDTMQEDSHCAFLLLTVPRFCGYLKGVKGLRAPPFWFLMNASFPPRYLDTYIEKLVLRKEVMGQLGEEY